MQPEETLPLFPNLTPANEPPKRDDPPPRPAPTPDPRQRSFRFQRATARDLGRDLDLAWQRITARWRAERLRRAG
jgi:hypothetical protein